jgi:hypothetical protein
VGRTAEESPMKKMKKKFRKKNDRAELLLMNLAQVLDECYRNKLDIKLRHGIIVSKYGYVLPFKRRWVVRMLVEHPLSVDYDDDED